MLDAISVLDRGSVLVEREEVCTGGGICTNENAYTVLKVTDS